MRALGAIDACGRVAADFQRTQQRGQAHQRAVGAEIAAPEVLNQNRQQHKRCNYDGCGLLISRKKFSIFTSAISPYGEPMNS